MPAIDADTLHWITLAVTRCKSHCSLFSRARDAFADYVHHHAFVFPFLITTCDCPNPQQSEDSSHHFYQAQCLQATRALINDWASSNNTFPGRREANDIFENFVDSSLLQNCAFEARAVHVVSFVPETGETVSATFGYCFPLEIRGAEEEVDGLVGGVWLPVTSHLFPDIDSFFFCA